jgi:hypothetical protein
VERQPENGGDSAENKAYFHSGRARGRGNEERARGEGRGDLRGGRRGTDVGSYLRCTAESRSPLGYVTCYSRIVTSRVSKAGGVER